MRFVVIVAAIVCTAFPMLPGTSPASAQGIETQFIRSRVLAQTPQCRNNPDAPVVGRVAGAGTGQQGRGLSFVGCFNTTAQCNQWRGAVSGIVRGRLIQNTCEARR
ncbi:MAG: hypothetical protein AAF580_00075 [Pseudomonadota bacterium]